MKQELSNSVVNKSGNIMTVIRGGISQAWSLKEIMEHQTSALKERIKATHKLINATDNRNNTI